MSLVISTTTPEGIVFGADSRQSYRNRKGMARIGSDNARKLFQINTRIGLAVTGLAFLEENGILKNISFYIDEFKKSNEVEKLSVNDVAKKIHSLLISKYKPDERFIELEKRVKQELEQNGSTDIKFTKQNHLLQYQFKDRNKADQKGITTIEMINVMVSGYNIDGSFEVYICSIPGDIQKKRDSKVKMMEYGADWLGQTDVVTRIILGFDPRISNLVSINDTIKRIGLDRFNEEVKNIQYLIQWGTMTLQDGIDFVDLMIKTTSAIQRFSDGIVAEPGDIPGVGGNVDIAVITADKGFVWINKKGIRHEDKLVDIDVVL